MSVASCTRGEDLRQVLRLGHWPEACDGELRAHVAECAHCTDLVRITEHLQAARVQSMSSAPVTSAHLLWLRAQARRRQAAIERAGRPIALAQVFALVVGLLAAGVLLTLKLRAAMSAHTMTAAVAQPGFAISLAGSAWMIELLAAGGALIAIAGVALYLTSERRDGI